MSPGPAGPAFVQFYPTLRCNLACDFCFNRGLAPVADVDPADFGRMLDRLTGAGVESVDLLGGEPTLHAGIEEIVAAIASRGMRATLSTNGHGDLALLERLDDRFGPSVLRVGVSVNGADLPAQVRDYIARRAPLVKSVCGRDWSLPQAAAEHLARPGTEYFLIFRDPLATSDLAESLSYPVYRERLAELQARHPRAHGVVCDGFVPGKPHAGRMNSVRCPAGTFKLSVLPDGSVYPCYLLFSRPEFRLGNLLTDPFETVWNNPALDYFRRFPGNLCPRTQCAHHAACHGGCPAVSLLIAGDLAAPDPRCVPG